MSQSSPEEEASGSLEGEVAGLGLALQHTLARRAAMGQRRLPRVDLPAQAPAKRATPSTPQAAAPTAPPMADVPAARPARPAQASPAPASEARPARPSFVAPASPPPKAPAAALAAASATESGGPKRLALQAQAAPSLEELRACVADCTACGLAATRTQTVFGDGGGARRILFVGEGPGEQEDREGVPFVGRAGALLDDIITKGMGISREDVYIANVVKCRPPENRDPLPEEKALCTAWLDRQIELLDPAVIIPLGRHAAGHILGVDAPLGRLRGKVHDHAGRKVVPTYHPAYLLRSPHEKRKTWEDIQLAMEVAGLPRRGA